MCVQHHVVTMCFPPLQPQSSLTSRKVNRPEEINDDKDVRTVTSKLQECRAHQLQSVSLAGFLTGELSMQVGHPPTL